MNYDADLDWMDELLSSNEEISPTIEDIEIPADIFDSKGKTVRHLNDIISVVQPDKRNEFNKYVYNISNKIHHGKTVRFRPTFDSDGIPMMFYRNITAGYLEVANNKSRTIRVADVANYKDTTEDDVFLYEEIVRLMREYRAVYSSKEFYPHRSLVVFPATVFRDFDGKDYQDPSFTFLTSYTGKFITRYLDFVKEQSEILEERGTSFVEEFMSVDGHKHSCIELYLTHNHVDGYEFSFKPIYDAPANSRMIYNNDIIQTLPSINKNYLCYDKFPSKELKEVQKCLYKKISIRNF